MFIKTDSLFSFSDVEVLKSYQFGFFHYLCTRKKKQQFCFSGLLALCMNLLEKKITDLKAWKLL